MSDNPGVLVFWAILQKVRAMALERAATASKLQRDSSPSQSDTLGQQLVFMETIHAPMWAGAT